MKKNASKIKKTTLKRYLSQVKNIKKAIKKYKSLISANKKSKYNQGRKNKIKALNKKITLLNSIITKKKFPKNFKKRLSDINKQLKKAVRKQKLTISMKEAKFIYLKDKYSDLIYGRRRFNKGLLRAFQHAGLLPFNNSDLDYETLKKINNILSVQGLSWEEVHDLIINKYSTDISTLFYKPEDVRKEFRVFDGNYFKGKITALIRKIRRERKQEMSENNPLAKLYKGR